MLAEIKQMSASTIVAVVISLLVGWAVLQVVMDDIDNARKVMIERFDKTNDRIDALMLQLIQAQIIDEEIGESPKEKTDE